jgi:hypothetical protein
MGLSTMLIPSSTASRLTLHFIDNRIFRNSFLADINRKFVTLVWLLLFGAYANAAILHAFRGANFTATRPKLILAP